MTVDEEFIISLLKIRINKRIHNKKAEDGEKYWCGYRDCALEILDDIDELKKILIKNK